MTAILEALSAFVWWIGLASIAVLVVVLCLAVWFEFRERGDARRAVDEAIDRMLG
jgi:hypothetical protein